MRMLLKMSVKGKTVITTESKRFLKNKIRRFEAQKEFPPGYWKWLELPDRILVPDSLSFQLDAWNKLS